MKIAYLGLGANLGDRQANLQAAVHKLHTPDLRVTRISSVYETAPRDYLAQPPFLNVALEAECHLFPMQLLARIGNVERELGRQRRIPKGPRSIDIDILFYGDSVMRTAQLEIPHPRLAERRFVLEPLAELAPELRHPRLRRTVRELLAGMGQQEARKTSIALELP